MPRARLAILFLLTALGAAACRSQPPRPRDVILIVVDTLRADRLGSYGNPRGLTPVLDRLAGRGARFTRAYAPCSWTMPSVASLFTSRLPSQHKVSDFDSKLSDDEITFAERLAAGGFATGGETANWRLTAALGYAQGFERWRGFFDSPGSPKKARGEILRTDALEWIDAPRPAGVEARPRLLYLQYMEPHGPLDAPAELQKRFAAGVGPDEAAELNRWSLMMSPDRHPPTPQDIANLAAMYDAEVAAVDAEIGRLFDALAQRGILDHALVLVTADHGEEFLEHGSVGHGSNLFNTTVHVPLIIAGPGIPAGRVVDENVSLIDLAPTLLDLLGLPPEPRFEGRSLAPSLRDATPAALAPVDIVVQLPPKEMSIDMRSHQSGLVRGMEKLLVAPDGAGVSFDLATDPGEQTPRDQAPDSPLRAALDAATAALATRQVAHGEQVTIDDATKEKLRALGYHP